MPGCLLRMARPLSIEVYSKKDGYCLKPCFTNQSDSWQHSAVEGYWSLKSFCGSFGNISFSVKKKNRAVDSSCFSVLKTFPLDSPWNLGIGSEKWSSHQASEMTRSGDPIMGLFQSALPSDPKSKSLEDEARSSWRRFCKTSPWRRWSKTSCPRGSDHFTIGQGVKPGKTGRVFCVKLGGWGARRTLDMGGEIVWKCAHLFAK